jgi:hypothetical protein
VKEGVTVTEFRLSNRKIGIFSKQLPLLGTVGAFVSSHRSKERFLKEGKRLFPLFPLINVINLLHYISP